MLARCPHFASGRAVGFTQNLQLVNPVPGDPAVKDSWGGIENNDRVLVDAAIAGILTVDLTTANNPNTTYYVLLSVAGQPDQARNARFVFTGILSANVTVFWPAGLQRIFSVVNNTTGAFGLTLAVNNGALPPVPAGSTVTIQQGNTLNLASDGANIQPNGVTTVFPAGTAMIFRQATAPNGWVQDVSANDRVLRMVSATGGGTGGSWVISGVTAAVAIAGHVLSLGEIPLHQHNININSGTQSAPHTHAAPNAGGEFLIIGGAGTGAAIDFGSTQGVAAASTTDTEGGQLHFHNVFGQTDAQGGGQGHTHPGSTTAIAADGLWRPAYADVIVCTKT